MLEFIADLSQFEAWKNRLEYMDYDHALSEIGELQVTSEHNTIDTAGRGAWPGPKKDYGHPLLKDTGTLYNSISYNVFDNTVTVDAGVDYAYYQNNGTENLPARDFLSMWPEDVNTAEEIIARLFS
jgi:phage gpG-like protein